MEQPQKRFRINAESFARERLKGLRESFSEIQKEYPEVVSLALFGSMTKGKAREESDIDGWIFVDASRVPMAETGKPTVEKVKTGGGMEEYRLTPDVAQRYSGSLREKLKTRLQLTDEQVHHLRTLAISPEILEDELLKITGDVQKLLTWENASGTKRGPRPDVQIPTNLYAMFHLSLGNDIRAYRSQLLERLNRMGDVGARAWKEIIWQTEFMEQGMPIKPTDRRYPRTLEEAVAMNKKPHP